MFNPIPNQASFPQWEETILRFWKERRIYEKSLERRSGSPKFVFYEGPPTANGLPHPGHCLTRAMKDLFPRYRTMRGYRCERKGGWDTHGLPVEVEVCKELGIHSKEEIENYGVEPFIHKCQESVWRYMKEWERLTERLGFWIHLDEAYVTYHQSYVESVWWSLKNLFDRGLLYQGHKIVWWWAQGGTALSSGEVGQGYREVADPSVYVRFLLLDNSGRKTDTSLLIWTTTPWTLASNQFAAVHPSLDYATVHDSETDQRFILASDLVPVIAEKVKRELLVSSTCKGSDLLGRRYLPPFDYYYKSLGDQTGRLRDGGTQHLAWRVVPADFVTTDSGTGVVHQAPAFGEVDFEVLLTEQARFVDGQGPQLINAVAPDGTFTAEAPDYRGRWVKDVDKDITRALRDRGLLYHREQYVHDYPFCWRAEDDPLIQYPRKSWFIRTTKFKDRMLENNRHVNWLPEHIKTGRMGNFLETNVDWALSRERYWGTPLPIWVCQQTGEMEAVATYRELLAKPGVQGTDVWETAKRARPQLPDDLRVHKPYIDAITYDSPFAAGSRMTRVSDVIDCWYDSGAMPFAQWGYPHQGRDRFLSQFPADFISEALDQTRGWFYSLMAISTLLFSEPDEESGADDRQSTIRHPIFAYPHPYRNCVVLGLMLGEDGGKMSKSKRNYREPQEIFQRYGADALRWYFFANQAPWSSIIYSERTIKESIPEFLLRLWNCYSFLIIYSQTSGFDPSELLDGAVDQLTPAELSRAKGYRPSTERAELDRWILSDLNQTVCTVVERMDAYDNYAACVRLHEFVDGLSNWYVRRSRDRFWRNWRLKDRPKDEIKQLPVDQIASLDAMSIDKLDAYWTLYECLLKTAKLIAPFTPFFAEKLWHNLAHVFGERAIESVHLCDYPHFDPTAVDEKLSARMRLLREIASLGRSARMEAKLKVRQPLAKVEVILADTSQRTWLEAHDELLIDELNVKRIEYTTEAERYISYQVQPNFKRLGPRLGKLMPAVKASLVNADGGQLLAQLNAQGKITLELAGQTLELDSQDIQIRLKAKEGWAAAQGTGCVVVLSTDLTPTLIREGYANDIVRTIQERRKELNCQYSDRIAVGIVTDSEEIQTAVSDNLVHIQRETLAVRFILEALPHCVGVDHEVSGHSLVLYVQVTKENAGGPN